MFSGLRSRCINPAACSAASRAGAQAGGGGGRRAGAAGGVGVEEDLEGATVAQLHGDAAAAAVLPGAVVAHEVGVGVHAGDGVELAEEAVALLAGAEGASGLLDGEERARAVVGGLPDLAEVPGTDALDEAIVGGVFEEGSGLWGLEEDEGEVLGREKGSGEAGMCRVGALF